MAVSDLITDPALIPLLSSSHKTLAHMLDMMNWVDQNQSVESSLETQLMLSKYQKTTIALLARLRGHNRRAIFGVRSTKHETAEARQEVDRLLLQLQNLYYEQRHLMGEIGACEGYDHAYTHLPLLPLDLYLHDFPDQEILSEQDLMPLRIEHEKQERENLENERLELVKRKENLSKANLKKKEELKKMDEQLEKMVDGFKPISEALANEL